MQRQPGCWLGSSHSFKECVTAHWSSEAGIDNKRASSIVPKLWIMYLYILVGEHSDSEEGESTRFAGVIRKANVGISNDNGGEKPPRRKVKDSSAMLIN